jgi:hypothetical protein
MARGGESYWLGIHWARLVAGSLIGINREPSDNATGAFDGVIFWTFSVADALGTLRQFGWPIS